MSKIVITVEGNEVIAAPAGYLGNDFRSYLNATRGAGLKFHSATKTQRGPKRFMDDAIEELMVAGFEVLDAAPKAAAKATPKGSSVARIAAMFAKASDKLKAPKVIFGSDAGKVVLSQSKNPKWAGTIFVGNGVFRGPQYGRIVNGEYLRGEDASQEIVDAILAFDADPKGVAKAYAKRVGSCSFCSRELVDPRSLAVGYGPICADHYGLPHGEVTIDTRGMEVTA